MITPSFSLRFSRVVARILYGLPGTGLPRIAEYLRRSAARKAIRPGHQPFVWIDDFCGNLKFCCDLTEHMGSQIFFKGSYSGEQLTLLRRLLREDSVFVDVGANQGEFTICAAGLIDPKKGAVHAFEPVSTVRTRLERNVAANGFTHVTIHSTGLSDMAANDVPIYGADAVFADGTENIGLPTLFDVQGRSVLLEKIALRRLDDVLGDSRRVDVVKIDVEGAEWSVLRGAEGIIDVSRPAIIFEANEETCRAAGYSIHELVGWLVKKDYRLWSIEGRGNLDAYDTDRAFCNVLALPKDRTDLLERVGV